MVLSWMVIRATWHRPNRWTILLERLDQPVEEAILIDIEPQQIIKRIAKRAQEEGRADDTEETVRNRLRVYAEQTAPVADYYAERGLLTRVLGDGSIDEIFQRILSILSLGKHPPEVTGWSSPIASKSKKQPVLI